MKLFDIDFSCDIDLSKVDFWMLPHFLYLLRDGRKLPIMQERRSFGSLVWSFACTYIGLLVLGIITCARRSIVAWLSCFVRFMRSYRRRTWEHAVCQSQIRCWGSCGARGTCGSLNKSCCSCWYTGRLIEQYGKSGKED